MVKEITDLEFDKLTKDKKVLVDCYASWCGPCRMLAPIIEQLADELDDYNFYKLDVDKNPDTCKQFGIMSIPTILIFEDGNLKNKNVGFISKEELEKLL